MEDDDSFEITIARENGETLDPGVRSLVRSAVEAALRTHNVGSARISIALVDDHRIAECNETYLHHTGPTDVLTFDLSEPSPGEEADSSSRMVEGDILLSQEWAAREVQSRKHAVEGEIALYAVHGVLHLLGYDDADEKSAARMHAMEDTILSAVGVGPIFGESS